MKIDRNEALFNGIILVMSCFLYYVTTTFPHAASSKGDLGADFWPKMILIGLIGISSFLTIRSIRRKKPPEKSESVCEGGVAVEQTNKRRLIVAGLIILTYVSLVETFGFIILTPFFLCFFLYNMGMKKISSLLIIPPIITLFIYLCFVKLMFVILPRGIWLFREVSILLY